MAARTGTGQYIPHGANETNIGLVGLTIDVNGVAAGDTLDLTLPAGMDKDLVPLAPPRVYSTATPAVELNANGANLVITNHNRTTGVTRFTGAAAGIAAGSKLIVLYGYCPA